MARDNFISDNLINIRDRLREKPVSQDEPFFVAENSVTAGKGTAEKSATAPLVSTLAQPAPRMQTGNPDIERDRRELAGRIHHDYSTASAELEILETRRAETEKYMRFLAGQQESVSAVDPDDSKARRELDRLAWEYCQMAGRWQAFFEKNANNAVAQDAPSFPHGSMKAVVAAVIISSLIISATLLVVFL